MYRPLLRWGFGLFLVSLLGAGSHGLMVNPRLGVSAHVTGLIGGILLVCIALVWQELRLGPKARQMLAVTAVWGTVGNWAGGMLGAFWGTNYLTPVAGGVSQAARWQEFAVSGILASVVLCGLGALAIVLRGLR